MSGSTKGKALKKEKKSWWGKVAAVFRGGRTAGNAGVSQSQQQEPLNKQADTEAVFVEEPVFTEPELEIAATSAVGYEEERIEELDLSSLSLEELLELVSATTPSSKRAGESEEEGQEEQVQPVEKVHTEAQVQPEVKAQPEAQDEQAQPITQAPAAEQPQSATELPQPIRSVANLVDLNNTTVEELTVRLGLSQLDAQKALSVCEAVGGFASLQQFCDALGFRPHVIERLRPLVKISPRQKR